MQPQNKGPGMLWGCGYVTPMMSCDITWYLQHNRGLGCVRGGVCHGEFKVDNFHMIILQILHKPAWNLVKLLCKYSYLIPSQFQASQSDKIHDIRQFKYSNFKSFHLLFDVGGPPSIMAGSQSNFWILAHFYQDLCNSCVKSEARTIQQCFFTYIQKFTAFKLVAFMAYTYNIQGWQDGTRHWPLWWPHWPSPVTAAQPHVNSHFVYI